MLLLSLDSFVTIDGETFYESAHTVTNTHTHTHTHTYIYIYIYIYKTWKQIWRSVNIFIMTFRFLWPSSNNDMHIFLILGKISGTLVIGKIFSRHRTNIHFETDARFMLFPAGLINNNPARDKSLSSYQSREAEKSFRWLEHQRILERRLVSVWFHCLITYQPSWFV